MLPSLTSGCKRGQHGDVRQQKCLAGQSKPPGFTYFIAVFREKDSVFSLVYFMRFPGFGAVALVVQICLRGFPAFFLSLPPIKQYQENYEDFRHECMLRLKN